MFMSRKQMHCTHFDYEREEINIDGYVLFLGRFKLFHNVEWFGEWITSLAHVEASSSVFEKNKTKWKLLYDL